jgi:hypothetical protein
MVDESRDEAAKARKGYYESEDHVPDHTALMGTLDTSGTAGPGGDSELENLAPVFRVAKARDLAYARRAVDPQDTEIPEDLVTLSTGISIVQGDPDGDRKRLTEAANDAEAELDTYGYRGNFDPQSGVGHDRRAQAEQAWAASIADMSPALIVGGNSPVPAAPPQELAKRRELLQPQSQRDPHATGIVNDEDDAQTGPDGSQEAEEPREEESETQEPTSEQESAQEPEKAEESPSEVPVEESYHQPKADVKAPNKASSKTEWVEWAVACGAKREDAEPMSRLQLIEQFGKYRPNEQK